MNRAIYLFVFFAVLLSACKESGVIKDSSARHRIESDLKSKQEEIANDTLFSVFQKPMTADEKDAISFLYAYMPLGDITDYNGELFLSSVKTSLKAKEEMPWGDSIPDDIFRHYVLPLRINNENLDSSRIVFYDELKDRVKGLSMYDAVLEVNHWCHEKAIYTPSDARTSSPLATMKTAYGRCGEESTFTTAALRAVGIPARQVYTPRWAHTDDNHAWVEAWVNGKWYFLGACEPEPVLNLGWFNGPAYRGMLMHTKVFGNYAGSEEIMDQNKCFTEINITENYAPVASAVIKVVDTNGAAIANASVDFKVYNYAELFTVAHKIADQNGLTSLTAGLGDMIVWASQNNQFGLNKVSFGKQDTVTVILDKKQGDIFDIAFDLVPPVDGSIQTPVTEEQKAANATRLQEEDKIRNAYVATFMNEASSDSLAQVLGMPDFKVWDFIQGSRGNWKEIESFLINTPADQKETALALLEVISAKDLRDTPESVLIDHLSNSKRLPGIEEDIFVEYVLNPRIKMEMLSPYKGAIQSQLDAEFIQKAVSNPEVIIQMCKDLKVLNDLNPQKISISPVGVLGSKLTDDDSRDLFFVAVCRSIGIPARIESVTGKTQYFFEGKWVDVNFSAPQVEEIKQGTLTATYNAIKALEDPKYYSHFSIAEYRNNTFETLNFRNKGGADMEAGNSWSNLLKKPLSLDQGYYMMVTGTRMANGTVLVNLDFFDVSANKATETALVMRENKEEIQVIGTIDPEAKFYPAGSHELQSILNTTGRGYFVLAILGARQEPTNHAMRDLAKDREQFEKWGRQMVLLFKSEKQLNSFDKAEFPGLPSNITFGVDDNDQITNMIVKSMNLPTGDNLPIFIIADTFGRVVFVSQGYRIGLGEQMLKVISKL